MEEWKEVIDHPGYEVSNLGRVRSLDRVVENNGRQHHRKGKILRLKKSGSGYLGVSFNHNGIEKCWNVHRLVAIHFLENKHNYDTVNHKDRNRHNNVFTNLEWCTRSYNMIHGYLNNPDWIKWDRRGEKNPKAKKVLAIKDTAIWEFDALTICAKELNLSYPSVKQAFRIGCRVNGYKLYAI